jgi:hypothetical protein
MVEIKRTRAGQGYKLSRIGVVNVQSGSERVYEQKAKGYGQFADFMFEQTASLQKKAGAEFAAEAQVLDDDGKVVSKKIPSGLGKFGREVAVKEINRRMSIATQNEMKSVAAQFKLDAKTKPNSAEYFRANMETYLAQRTKDITESGGEDFLPTFNEIAYNIGSLAEMDIKLERQQQLNDMAANEELSLFGDQATEAYNMAISGNVDNAREYFNEITEAAKSSTLLDATAKARFNAKAKSDFRLGVVRSAARDKTPAQLSRLSSEAKTNVWSEETLKENPQLEGVNLSEDEWNQTKTYYNGVAKSASSALEKEYENYRFNKELNSELIANTKSNQDLLSRKLGYDSMLDVLSAPVSVQQEENNAPISSTHLKQLAVSFSTGLLPDEQLLPTLNRLTNVRAAQQYKNKTLDVYFGGDQGEEINIQVKRLNMLRELGGDNFAIEAYKTSLFNKANPSELLKIIRANSEFIYDAKSSDEQNIRNAARYELNKLTNIPSHLRDKLLPAAETFLGTPELSFSAAVTAYARDKYSGKDGFYEQSGKYNKYPYSPSNFLDTEGQTLLREMIDAVAPEKKVYLMPLSSSSDKEVLWQPYYLNDTKGQEIVGRPISLNGFSKHLAVKKAMGRMDYIAMQLQKRRDSSFLNEINALIPLGD